MTRVIAVTGGKGGTGKSTVAVNLAFILAKKHDTLLVDADVDGPCDQYLLSLEASVESEVRIFKPKIVESACVKCGRCVEVCYEKALVGFKGVTPKLLEERCSGCKSCLIVCRVNAIESKWKTAGWIKQGGTDRLSLLIGELKPGEPRSPIIVKALMDRVRRVKEQYEYIVVDTSPGTHNSVFQALKEVDESLIVTEPTPLGIHDLKLILKLISALEVKAGVIINKSGISGLNDEVKRIARDFNVRVVSEIPYDKDLIRAYVSGKPVVEFNPESPAAKAIRRLAEKLLTGDLIE